MDAYLSVSIILNEFKRFVSLLNVVWHRQIYFRDASSTDVD